VPEGDTIFRSARALDLALAGRRLVRFDAARLTFTPFPPETTVLGAESWGKHCLVRFDDGRTLHTHLRMSGSWHLYRPGERWRRKPATARVVVEVDGVGTRPGWVAVCFAAPVVELVRADAGGRDGVTDHLGPDLCRPDADLDEAVDRLGRLSGPGREIGDALLDQRIACGVGNVYNSEVCFACGLDPFTPVGEVDPASRRALLATAARLLRRNLATAARATVAGVGLAVYGRAGAPFRRCATPVAAARQGDANRVTYWCPGCQRRP
jgi:endonuclease VIII